MEENKKIVNKLYIIIALLGLIILILGGFLAYRELSSSKDDKINTEENNNNQNNNSSEIEELDVNSDLVESGKDGKISEDTSLFSEVIVKCGEKKDVKIGNKILEINNSNFEIIVDGKKLYSDMNSCGDNVYVINNNLLIITDNSSISFFDENLNKIAYSMEENDSDIKAHTTITSGEKSVPYINRYGKIIVTGTRQADFNASSIYLDGEFVYVCDGGKIKQDIYDKVIGKIVEAEYELNYDNNRLTFKRVEGSEYKINESYCKY